MEGLVFDPFALEPGELMWKKYPALSRRKEFCTIPKEDIEKFDLTDLNKLIKFTVLFIDPLSPLFSERDFEYRTQKALEALSYDTDERFYREVEDETLYWHTVLAEYFKMVNNHNYESWFSMKVNFNILNKKLRVPGAIKDSDRRGLTKDIGHFREELIELEHKLFPDEYSTKIIAAKVTEQGVKGFAEKYALYL